MNRSYLVAPCHGLFQIKTASLALCLGLLVSLAGCKSGKASAQAQLEAACQGTHWVAAWRASPTDGIVPGSYNLQPLLTGPDQTFRAILSPTGGGQLVRIQLSNRFGVAPLTVAGASIARQGSGAALVPGSVVPLRFNGSDSIDIPPGQDVVSDPVGFQVAAFDNVAVSVYTRNAVLAPTHHFLARQTSFATLPFGGNHVTDDAPEAFVQSMTTRPFVVGLDVMAPRTSGTVVAFGDSLTDGDQQRNFVTALLSLQVPTEDPATIDKNQRYPDFLARRLQSAGRKLFVANAGIGGNQVRQDSPIFAGPSALTRLDPDVLKVAGVTDVIFMEGINDIGQTPGLTLKQLTDAYVQVINRLHAAGLNVLQGTLTPSGSISHPALQSYRLPNALALRQAVNAWIRTTSPADGIVDFDAAVRDPANPDVILPAFDGGDGLHFNAAGYERMAEAVDLALLKGPAECRR